MTEHHLPSLKRRRITIVCVYIGFAIGFASYIPISKFVPDFLRGPVMNILMLGLMLFPVSWLRSLGYARQRYSEPNPVLDERQQLMRLKAHRISYYITIGMHFLAMMGCIFYLVLARNQTSQLEIREIIGPIAFALIYLTIAHVTLPQAMIAWLEPDLIKEEIFEGEPA